MVHSRYLWLIFVALILGALLVQKPDTLADIIKIVVSAYAFVFFSVATWIAAVFMIRQHVSTEAKAHLVSTPRMWLVMFKRTAMYVILPAFIIFSILMAGVIAYTLLGGENKYF